MPGEHSTNRVLAALAHADQRPWRAHLQRVDMRPGHTLMAPHVPMEYVYFPEDALVGLLQAGEPGGAEVPLALVGNDGVVGVAPFLGAPAERLRAQVLHPGSAWRLATEALSQGPQPGDGPLRVVLGYLQALDAQMAKAALCRLQHAVYPRLCRWLQDAFDRVPGTVLHIEPTALGAWVGAEPAAVAQATAQLVAEGAVALEPGRISLLDRGRLEQHACGCHQPVQPTL